MELLNTISSIVYLLVLIYMWVFFIFKWPLSIWFYLWVTSVVLTSLFN